MSLNINQIRTDGGTQSRAAINDATVAEYAEAMADPVTVFPPVIVYFDGKEYWLADGFHRLAAWAQIGRTEIPTEIRQGDRRRAILHSVAANSAHGLRRTNEDKRRAVMTLLEDDEWGQWPDVEIARRCAVGRNFVHKLRGEITCTPSASDAPEPVLRKYIDRYGNERVMNVAKIGSGQSKSRPLSADEVALLRDAPTPSVYVLTDGNRCKIGWSRTVKQRVEGLLTQSPDARLMAIAPGGTKEERAVHEQLSCERDIGEWFVVQPAEVLAVMAQLGMPYTANIGAASKPDQETKAPETPEIVEPEAKQEAESALSDQEPAAPETEADAVLAKVKRELAKMTAEGVAGLVMELRTALADAKVDRAKLKAEVAKLKETLKQFDGDKDQAIKNLSRTIEHKNSEMFRANEKAQAALRTNYALKKRIEELEKMGVVAL